MSKTESMLGAHIFIVTIFDERMLGELFSVHQNEQGLHLVLRHHLANGHRTFTWMKTSIIAEVAVLEGPQFAAADEVLPPLSKKRRGWICRKVTHGWQRREDYCISRRQKKQQQQQLQQQPEQPPEQWGSAIAAPWVEVRMLTILQQDEILEECQEQAQSSCSTRLTTAIGGAKP